VAVDVTAAFAAYTAGNRGPTPTDPYARERPDYGLSAVLDGNAVELTLTFRAGAAYCCGEWQCHFMLFPDRRWDRLRRVLSATGAEVTGRLELRIAVIIEEGALFLAPDPSSPRTLSVMAPARAFEYRQVLTEGDGPDAEPFYGL
jgi:hypothetical protein